MPKRLNTRQKLTAKELIKTNGNLSKAMINAGYSNSYANDHPEKLSGNIGFMQQYESNFNKALKKAGIDDETLAKCLQEGLKAERSITFQGEVKKKEPDQFMRQRFLETALKVRGDFAPEKLDLRLGKKEASEVFEQRLETLKTVLTPSTPIELASPGGETTLEKAGEYEESNPQAVAGPTDKVKSLEDSKIEE